LRFFDICLVAAMLPSARETLKKEFVREIRFVEEPVSL